MKAAALQDGKFIITNRPKPILDEYGEGAIVKVIGCGLCGSDIVKIRNGQAKDGDVLGHEVVGEIVEMHEKKRQTARRKPTVTSVNAKGRTLQTDLKKREKERKMAYSLSGLDSVSLNAQQVRRETLKDGEKGGAQ